MTTENIDLEKLLKIHGKAIIKELDLEDDDEINVLKKLNEKLIENRNAKNSKIIRKEMFDMIQFNEENQGYEDYILFVSELLENDNKYESQKYLELLYKRYNNFDEYYLDYDSYYLNKITPKEKIINEFYSRRNIDLLMMAAPNLEETMLNKKKLNEMTIYHELKLKNPLLGLEFLVSHKKRMNNTFKKDLYDRIRKELTKKEKVNKNELPLSIFLKSKINEFNDNDIVNGLYIRKKVTPLGTLPAKKIIDETKQLIDNYENEFINDIDDKNTLNDEKKLIDEFGKDFAKLPKNKNSFMARLNKFKNKIIILATVSLTFTFSPVNLNLIKTDNIFGQLNIQSQVYEDVKKEEALSKYTDYEIKEHDNIFKIARMYVSKNNPNFSEIEVTQKVREIIKDNKETLENPNKLNVGDKIKIKVRAK